MNILRYILAGWLLLAITVACTRHPDGNIKPTPENPEQEENEFFTLQATEYSAIMARLTWQARPGNPVYQILRRNIPASEQSPVEPFVVVGETQQPKFDDLTVRMKTGYIYVVKARYTTGKVEVSEEIITQTSSELTAFDRTYMAYEKMGVATGGKRYEATVDVLPQTIIDIVKNHIGNQSADIVLLMDNTGSMSDYIDACRAGLNQIISALPTGTRLGAGGYRDRGDLYLLRFQDLTTNYATVRSFLDQSKASGGGDEPEAIYDAVYGVVTQASWSSQKRIIMVIGDSAPHEAKSETDHSYQEVVDKCRQMGVNVNLFPILLKRDGSYSNG